MAISGAADPKPDVNGGSGLGRLRKAVAVVCLLLVLARAFVAPYQKLFPGPWWVDWLTFLVPMALFFVCLPRGSRTAFARSGFRRPK